MDDVGTAQEWSPQTPPVSDHDLRTCAVVVLHYWAVWDAIDREMDKRILALTTEYGDRICFRSCDIDRAENRHFIHGIANIPALGCFIRGDWHKSLIGLRGEDELRRVFDTWLGGAAGHNVQRPHQSAASRIAAVVRSFVRRFTAPPD